MIRPRLARALLERLVHPRLRDAIIGDLDELFADECVRRPVRAWLHYWVRTADVLAQLGIHRARRAPLLEPLPKGDGVMTSVWTDLRHGVRLFTTQPGYALAATLTLALAIGANTLIFTMANVLVLKPFPMAEPDRLAWIFGDGRGEPSWRGPLSLPEYAAFRDRATTIHGLAAWRRGTSTLSENGHAERIVTHVVAGDLHGLWRLAPAYGRTLSSDDEQPSAPAAVVLSHRFWQTRFGGRTDVLGQQVRLDGAFHTVVGVLSPAIELGNFAEIDAWLPYRANPSLASRTDRAWRAVGRLTDGTSPDAAHAQVAAIAQSLAREHPDTNEGRTARVGPTRDALGSPSIWVILGLLFTVVGLLLLLACANIMNLLIARLVARRPELAVRTALGATHGRIVRQIVAENLVLGVAGGVVGIALARAGLAAIHAVAYEPFFRQLAIDWYVLAFAAALSFVAPLIFSIGPAMRMLRDSAQAALSDANARSIGSRGTRRAQSALVVTQVAVGVTLLVVAGLVVQSMQAVSRVDVGYNTAGLISTHLEIPVWKVTNDAASDRLRNAFVQRAAAIPGVRSAAAVTGLPALHAPRAVTFRTRTADTQTEQPVADLTVASAAIFDVLQLPIVAGRGFVESDAASPAPVAVVSEEMARRHFGGVQAAQGAHLSIDAADGESPLVATVVGVAADVHIPGLVGPARQQVYMLDAHVPTRSFYLVVRAERPESLAEALRTAIREVDPEIPAYQLRTVAEGFDDEFSSNQLLSGLFMAFAALAISLAAVGLYAVMSFAVNQRTREIALRVALGASARDVAANVASHSLTLAGLGVVLGLAGAFVLEQSARSVLFGVGPTDPATYLGAVAVTALAAVTASWMPIRRAMAVDPAQGLRQG